MAEHRISSILGGYAPTLFHRSAGQFTSSVAIDPDLPLPGNPISERATGGINPAPYEKFSDTVVNSAPMWFMTNPKNALVYTYLFNGRFVSYDSALASETNIGTPTSGAGNGAVYYNNYVYLMTPTDVSRYGPLNNSPSLTNTVWSGATLGSQTALTNTTYPSISSVNYPNHAGHLHSDNAIYFCDFINGQGLIHKIKTKKTTDEGDTDDGSAYNVLDLPFGYLPTDIESYGSDLAILAIQTTITTLNQGQAALFLWDTFASSFYIQIPINNPLATALFNRNGTLHTFSGNRNSGFVVSRYLGGYTFEDIDFFEEGLPPFAGAVDAYGSRLSFGSSITDPLLGAVVWGLGYKSPKLPSRARHSIASATLGGGTTPIITAVKYVQQASGISPKVIMGWHDNTGDGIDKAGGTDSCVFKSEVFHEDTPFVIDSIRFALSRAVGSTTTIVPKIFYDNETTAKTLATVNDTNYTNSERVIHYKAAEIEASTTTNFLAQFNFLIQFTLTGTDNNPILLPVIINTTPKTD